MAEKIMRAQLRISARLHSELVKEAKAEMRSLQNYLHVLIDEGRRIRRMDRLAGGVSLPDDDDFDFMED